MTRSTVALGLVLCVALGAVARPSETQPAEATVDGISIQSDEDAVKAVVIKFLTAIGNYDLDALPPMFTENANIGSVSIRNGEWHATTYTFEEFLSTLKARTNPSYYQEPVSRFTVHIEEEGLAFVRADATLIKDNQPRSNNIDYFTLMKEGGTWRFLSASYVARPSTE